MTYSFRKKIFWSFVTVVVIASIISMVLAVFLLLRQSEQEAQDRILAEEKNLLSLGVMDFISLVEYREFIEQIPTSIPTDQLNEVIHIYIPPGKLLYTNQHRVDLNVPSSLERHVDKGFYEIVQNDRGFLALLRSYQTSDGKTLWLEIATQRTRPWKTIRGMAGIFIVTFLGLIGLSLLYSFWLGRKISSPIESFADEISKLESKDIKIWKRLPLEYERMIEIRPIVHAFNILKDRLQQTFIRNEYLGRFIAHEIRTPLTVIQGEIEIAMGEAGRSPEQVQLTKSILEEVNKISDVVGTVLKMPYGDKNSTPVQIEPINLNQLLAQSIEDLKKTYDEIELTTSLSEDLKIHTDPYLFSMLLSNLVRNAHQHGSSERPILINASSDDKNILIVVSDKGAGLAAPILDAANSPGAFAKELGIGLILSKQIADLLRLGLRFENRADRGLSVTILSAFFR